ncbi:hypothetical protein B0H12DRAFT_1233802 [Mycena haematopus]|nr:hypothetical protein B0H12DRAFT_1233802 [Mycena haematopus]
MAAGVPDTLNIIYENFHLQDSYRRFLMPVPTSALSTLLIQELTDYVAHHAVSPPLYGLVNKENENAVHFYISFMYASDVLKLPPTPRPRRHHPFASNPEIYQEMPMERVLNDRPESGTSIAPAALLYAPFGKFIDIYNAVSTSGVESVKEDVLRRNVERLAREGRKYYENEARKRSAMLPILNEIFAAHTDSAQWPQVLQFSIGSIPGVATDRHRGPLDAASIIVDFKNELMKISSEAEYEAVAYATQSHAKATEKHGDLYNAYRVPTLCLTMQGPFVAFYALIILHALEYCLGTRLLFLATAGSRNVLVKFTTSYCPALHQFCEAAGHAPKLLGHQRIPGGWHVIVMEHLQNAQSSSNLDHSRRFKAYAKIKALASEFHKQGFVHGDLRTANILMPAGWGGSTVKLQMVDFDWGGKTGEARFPTPLLTAELQWRSFQTVESLLITAEDDMQVLARTFRQGSETFIPVDTS